MSESELREALLEQNGSTSVETELNVLNGLVEAEDRRARRLKFWTIAVWVIWLAMLVVMFVATARVVERAHLTPTPPAPWPSTQPAPRPGLMVAVGLFNVSLLLIGIAGMSLLGTVLLVLLMLSRRSASVIQLRASVTAIDAQLRQLAAAQKNPTDGPSN
jgi:hypothetical protein